MCLYRRLEAPESYCKFYGALKAENAKAVLDGFYTTERHESATFSIVAALLLILALLVVAFSLSRGTPVSIVFGIPACVALALLGYKVIQFHRNTFRREAESLGEVIRNVLGEGGA